MLQTPDMALSLDGGLLIGGVEVIEDKVLGRGSYGVVYEARYYGAPVAAKRLHSIFFEAGTSMEGMAGMLKNFSHEWSLLRRLKHPNVVEFFGVYCPSLKGSRDDPERSLDVDEECFIICELLVMSLQERICQKPSLNFRQCVDISLQIASGLRYLHERSEPIMHRDLAAKNVLLSQSGEAKIADLGVAKAVGLSRKLDTFTRHPGTDSYMPVEVRLANVDYNESIDVFALGIIVLELCISRDSVASEPFIMREDTLEVIPEMKRREFDFETLHQRSEYRALEKIICHCLEEKKLRPTAGKVSAELVALKSSQDYRSTPEVPVIESGLQSQGGVSVVALQQEIEGLKMMLRDRDWRMQELTDKISLEQAHKDRAYRQVDEANQKLEKVQASDNFKQTRITELQAEINALAQRTAEKTADRELDVRRPLQRLTRLGSMPIHGEHFHTTSEINESGIYPQQPMKGPTISSQSEGHFRHPGIHTIGGRRTEMVVSGPTLSFLSASSRERSVPNSTANFASLQYPQPVPGDDYFAAASGPHMLSRKGEQYPYSTPHPHHPPRSRFGEGTLGQEIKQPPPSTGRRLESFTTNSLYPEGANLLHSRGKAFQYPASSSAQLLRADEKSGVIPRSIHLAEAPATIQDHGATVLEDGLTAFKKGISNLVPASKQSDVALLEQARAIRLQGEQLQHYLQSSGYYKEASRPRDCMDDEEVPHQLQLQKECDKMLRTVHYIMGAAVTGDDCLLHAARSLVDSGATLLSSITPDLD